MTNYTKEQLAERMKNNPELIVISNTGSPLNDTRDRLQAQTCKNGRGNKYNANKTEFNNRTYDSGKEAARAADLQLMEKVGTIFNLGYQVRFPLPGNIYYVADFVYLDEKLKPVIEDVKGIKTPVYRMKKKLFEEKYGVDITEV